ncbi:MAG: aminomethyl-transferring glycine dehydrogenase subunit GcvPA [Acidobacteriota bacterium]|nr:aminomethyl-transferring glycine dehydrogenase subunit GcvPA [Acidobacteriota bacterium]
MRYLPKSPDERKLMLDAIGAGSVDELFAPIPERFRFTRDLCLPPQMAESEIVDWFRARAAENANGQQILLGAGAYNHYRPLAIDTLISRGEWFTAYTPYQPEIAQGTLQAIFEFQTMICGLTGMEVANASMYDGSTGAAEAVMMAMRVTGRHEAILARSVHPEYREVIATYAKYQGLPLTEVGFSTNGRVDLEALDKAVTDKTACVLIQSPNFFGTIEDVVAIADIVHAKGALLVVSVAEALSLALVKPPAEADIVALEAQSFGVPLSYGGPYAGVIATREKFIRQIPGRLAGQTTDRDGKRGFVLTLSTREQHIRREKATSNICTNQALVALMVNIYMDVYGKVGLRELAEQNLAKAAYARKTLGAKAKVLFEGAPRFNEFVIEGTADAEAVFTRLSKDKNIVAGLPLKRFYPELGNTSLWCATELTSREAIDTAAEEVAR